MAGYHTISLGRKALKALSWGDPLPVMGGESRGSSWADGQPSPWKPGGIRVDHDVPSPLFLQRGAQTVALRGFPGLPDKCCVGKKRKVAVLLPGTRLRFCPFPIQPLVLALASAPEEPSLRLWFCPLVVSSCVTRPVTCPAYSLQSNRFSSHSQVSLVLETGCERIVTNHVQPRLRA